MAEQIQYVTLGVAEEIFAAPVATVQEILDMLPIARLPR
ncbi:MAG TPA: chemotaxis protein CheW, partial [Pelagibacterium sp.]|nr:chemotaxis protein CheW [Pelagibacterium sp.]